MPIINVAQFRVPTRGPCGASLLLVLFLAPRVFPEFSCFLPSTKNRHFPNSNSIRKQWTNGHLVDVPLLISIFCLLQLSCILSSKEHVLSFLITSFEFQNACLSNPCTSNATCQAGFGDKGYRCVCPQGYHGDQCELGKEELNKFGNPQYFFFC